MSDRDDEFRDLRELWNSASPNTGLGDSLEAEDERTQRSVLRLREAWQAIEVPSPLPLAELQQHRSSPWNPARLRTGQVFALAAAALILLAVALGLRSSSPHPRRAQVEVAEHVSDSPNTPDIQVEVTDDQRLVLRSGPVRLYLAMATPDAGEPDSLEPNSQRTEPTSR